jgi:ribosomal protein L23
MQPPKITPYRTEKSTAQAKLGKFTFLVEGEANAQMIGETVRRLFNVHPVRVSMLKNAAKGKGFGKNARTRPAKRKAIVFLKKGEKLSEFEIEEKK